MTSRAPGAALLCLLGMSVASGTASAASEDPAPAASARYALNIRAGLPLEDALQDLARQTRVQLVFFSQITAGRSAPALTGDYTLTAALTRLLDGSGLTFRQVNERTFEVRQAPARSPRSQVTARTNGDARRSAPSPASGDLMEEVQVVATVEQLAATRVPTPLREIPQSVSVISSEQIRQQNAFDLADVMRNAPGIATRRTSSLDEDAWSRAYQVNSYHVDGGGALKPTLYGGLDVYEGTPDLSEFDRVEVLRGSDALFTGNSNPGGTVSLVRKRPRRTSAVEISATQGSWNNRRIELDATGPLMKEGALRGRADAVYADRDYFFDRAHLERKRVFGALEYDVTSTATVTAGGSYQWDDALPVSDGLPLYQDGSDPHFPRSTSLSFDWAYYHTRVSELYAQYRQQLADDWSLRINVTIGRTTVDTGSARFSASVDPRTLSAGVPAATFTLRPDRFITDSADLTLTGAFDWLGLHGQLAAGGDYTRVRGWQLHDSYLGFGPVLFDVRTFDPANYPDPRGTRTADLTTDFWAKLEQYGAFLSLRVDLNEAWSVTGGGRVATDVTRVGGRALFSGVELQPLSTNRGATGVVTPYGALLYRISEHLSWYASYADVYLSHNGTPMRADGSFIGPKHGVNLETGLKGAWREGTLNGSLSVYQTAQGNVPLPDRANSLPGLSNCCFVTGEARSRGAEIEVDGELARGWLVGSGYTFNLHDAADGGIPVTSSPRHLLKIWTSTALPGALSAWTVGGSVRAQTAARGNLLLACDAQFQNCRPTEVVGQRAYAVLDLRAAFEINPSWEVALSVNNVLDKRYYLSQNTPAMNVWYGDPRNFMLRIDASF